MVAISVIVPVYNLERYVARCLGSIAIQTFHDFECIIIDDGSTDSSGMICDSFCHKDSRFRVIHQANAGLGEARNVGLDNAKGEYVQFIDGDDRIAPETFQLAYNAISQGDYNWVEYGFIREDPSGVIDEDYRDACNGETVVLTPEDEVQGFWGKGKACTTMAVWNKFYRRTVIGNLRFKYASIAEDLHFNCMFFSVAGNGIYLGKILYYWLNRPGSLSNSDRDRQKVRHFSVLLDVLDQKDFDNKAIRVIILQRLFRVSLTQRISLRETSLLKVFSALCRQLRKKNLKEYLKTKDIPLSERIICSAGWFFPLLSRTVFRLLGNP